MRVSLQVKSSINKLKMLSEIDDEYLKERAGDIRDIGNRLIKIF